MDTTLYKILFRPHICRHKGCWVAQMVDHKYCEDHVQQVHEGGFCCNYHKCMLCGVFTLEKISIPHSTVYHNLKPISDHTEIRQSLCSKCRPRLTCIEEDCDKATDCKTHLYYATDRILGLFDEKHIRYELIVVRRGNYCSIHSN